jgi:hypothetical protein
VEAIVAGVAAGYAMAILSSIAVAYLLARGIGSGSLDKWVDPEVSRKLLVVTFFLGSTAGWMMAGGMLGGVYSAADLASGPSVLGAENAWFALGMITLAVLPLPILAAIAWRQWWLWMSLSATFAVLFGWAVPYLAGR